MSFAEYALKSNLNPNPNGYPVLGSDKLSLPGSPPFATVYILLEDTPLLKDIADRIRADKGFFEPAEYAFTIHFNDYISDTHLDPFIEFYSRTKTVRDYDATYRIEFDEAEEEIASEWLDEQCKVLFGKGREDFLEEARRQMKETQS